MRWRAELTEATDFGLPGLKSETNFAACISGGVMRAASLAYGWDRALHEVSGSGCMEYR